MTNIIRIIKAEAFKYTVPLINPFSTSRHTTSQSTNYLIRLSSERGYGIGEAAARGVKLTGDRRTKDRQVLDLMLGQVRGATLDISSRETVLNSISEIYSSLESVAKSFVSRQNRGKPFRGLLSGFDIALLDLVAKELGISVAELLGENRTVVRATASTCSTSKGGEELKARLMKQARRFEAYRCKGEADIEENFNRLNAMREVNLELDISRSYWLDLNEAMSRDEALHFVDRAIEWLEAVPSPAQELILEQPVKKTQYKTLCDLQRYVSQRLDKQVGRIVIMADESLWDARDFDRLYAVGGVGAVNIKVPKVGGLRPALALANHVHDTNPETLIYIGGMIGTSDISGRAIYHLVKALPRIDHCTTSPARNVEQNLASMPLRFSSASSNEIVLGDAPGLGTDINQTALEQYCVASFPELADHVEEALPGLPVGDGRGLNAYELPELMELNQKELDSHLMEREALLYGLTAYRHNGLRFTVRNGAGRKASFYWTIKRGMSTETREICQKKYRTKEHFAKAGVPIAEGRCFEVGQREEAVSYAKELGWPLVVKPGVGTGGVGVTANIRNETELLWALEKLTSNDKVVSRNDGKLIIERHIDGTELRIFVAGGKAVGAIKRIPPHVVGDGESSIKELVVRKNALRKLNPRLSRSLLKLNESAELQLSRQGLTVESVPGSGECVTLGLVSSISQGADTQNVFDEVHPSILDAAVRAVAAIPGLERAGLDVIVADHVAELEGQASCVCEANTSPSIAASHFPMYGRPINVAKQLFASAVAQRLGAPSSLEHEESAAIHMKVVGELTPGELARAQDYFERHGVEGGCWSCGAEIFMYAYGDVGAVCALPANLSAMMKGRKKLPDIESRLVERELEWQDIYCHRGVELFLNLDPMVTEGSGQLVQDGGPLSMYQRLRKIFKRS